MGTMIAEDSAPAVTDALADYRTVSKSAIIAALLVLPAGAFVLYSIATQLGLEALPGVLPLPLVGITLGVIALSAIRRYPNEYVGKPLALFALIGHLALLAVSVPSHAYIQATEVPEGYQAISFSQLQPDPEKGEAYMPRSAFDLTGKRVFIKGYIHPGVASAGKVDHFILVRDFGTCCFGGTPQPTHMMEVKIVNTAPRVKYSTHMVRLAGTFVATPPQSADALGIQDVIYHLEADYVKH
ncbi:MAG TPA: hypothetical protein VFB96_24930 [Pirellulaceae bacterium]|nr:hypothetical protein [Pirellulaceae bacterium]